MMRLPDFIIIGAAKSGTTTLYQYLCRHPQIYMSSIKETEFFAKDEIYDKGIEWYASLFSQAESSQICGEGSVQYTLWPRYPQSAQRMAEVIPNVKLIYIMRHPVDRAYASYRQRVKYDQNKKITWKVEETFEERIEREPDIISASNYMLQINQYLQWFPRESFLFLFQEDLRKEAGKNLQKVCKFMGVNNRIDLIQNEPIYANVAQTHIDWFTRARMTEPLRKIPGLEKLARLLPQSTRDIAYDILTYLPVYKKSVEKKYLTQPMKPETRAKLLEKFHQPNQKLADFLNCDLSHWGE